MVGVVCTVFFGSLFLKVTVHWYCSDSRMNSGIWIPARICSRTTLLNKSVVVCYFVVCFVQMQNFRSHGLSFCGAVSILIVLKLKSNYLHHWVYSFDLICLYYWISIYKWLKYCASCTYYWTYSIFVKHILLHIHGSLPIRLRFLHSWAGNLNTPPYAIHVQCFAECDGTSGKPQPWHGMPVPGIGLQALTSMDCAFSGLHDATASPGAIPIGFTRSHISRLADVTEVAACPITQQTLTLQHTWARHEACGRP